MRGESKMTDIESEVSNGFNRLATGVAVASGLVLAAAISALPASTCYATTETYGRAIGGFGAAGIIASLAIIVSNNRTLADFWMIVRVLMKKERPPAPLFRSIANFSMTAISWLLAVSALTIFLASVGSGSRNLTASARYCLLGTPTEVANRAHAKIPLAGLFNWMARPETDFKSWDSPP